MIISWKDCIRFKLLQKNFLLPPSVGNISNINSRKAGGLADHNKHCVPKEQPTQEALHVLPAEIEINLKGTKPYKASTTSQIPLGYQASAER